MNTSAEVIAGEIQIKFNEAISGKQTFQDLGLSDEQLSLEGGLLRLVFNFDKIGDHAYFKVPTIEVAYQEEVAETHWICEFNGTTILDKNDHHGRSTVMLLNRNKITELEQHHENKLVVHAEFPAAVHLLAEGSYINFFN